MTDEQQRNFDHVLNAAIRNLKIVGSIDPMFIGYREENCIMIPGTFSNEQEKNHFLSIVKIVFGYFDVDHYCMAYEGWISEGTGYKKASEDPARIDALFVCMISREDRFVKTFKVSKDERGKVKSIDPYSEARNESVGGNFMELLSPIPMPEHVRELAKPIIEAYEIKLSNIPAPPKREMMH